MKPRMAKLLCLLIFLSALFGQWWFTKRFALSVDEEPDGVIYLAIAHNLIAHGIYSAGVGPALAPTYVRLPGYPWMIAGIFMLCGDGNQEAVRSFQALLTTLTGALVASLAFLWESAATKRVRAAVVAFLLAALCPFTAIYAGVIQAETLTIFLVMLLMVAAAWAFDARSRPAATRRWLAAGLAAGAVQLVRPEAGLFAAAVGFALLGVGLYGPRPGGKPAKFRWLERRPNVFRDGAVFSCGFVAMLLPWTVRNALVFHVFAPLPPAIGVSESGLPIVKSNGFCAWYRTWADSERYLEPFYWGMMTDSKSASVEDLPPSAFDTTKERERTAALFKQYNTPARPEDPNSPRAGLTPELDAAFAQVARERAMRSWWRYYVSLPLHRAVGLWFVPHAQYYSFNGSLFPSSKMNPGFEFHFWLPVFFALLCAYTALGLAGAWRLATMRGPVRANAWRWLSLIILVVLPRWVYLSTLENTEPRYMVEIFPFLCVLGGLALSGGRRGVTISAQSSG